MAIFRWQMPSKQQAAVLAIAQAELAAGVAEDPPGSNWGPRIAEYLACVGVGTPAPWCAAFVSWCVLEAQVRLQQSFEVPITAYTPHYLQSAGCEVLNNRKGMRHWLSPGQLALFYYPKLDGGRVGHIGIIEGDQGDGLVSVIEGNTNDDGSRLGVEVARRVRPIRDLYALVSYGNG